MLQDTTFIDDMRIIVKYYIVFESQHSVPFLQDRDKGVIEDINKDELLPNFRIAPYRR